MTRVGVVGLGAMGGGVAARLVTQGHDVSGYDASPAARDAASSAGVSVVDHVQDLVPGCEVLVTSLPDPGTVRAVLVDGGLAAALPAGAVLVELSTIDPATMRAVAAVVGSAVDVLDCPVSGGPREAASGGLTMLVGGDENTIARWRSVLDDLGPNLYHVGDVGTAKAVKLVNNVMSMANVLVASEMFAIGEAAGLDQQRLFDVLSVSGGSSSQFVKRFPHALSGDFEPRFTVALGLKDLGLALDLAADVGAHAPVTRAVRDRFASGVAEGLAGKDCVAMLELYRHDLRMETTMGSGTADLLDAGTESMQSCETQFIQYGSVTSFQGPIRTVRCDDDTILVKKVLTEPGDGHVLVIDGGGSLRCALLGDLSAASAVELGWAGVIINGAVRDVAELRKIPLGVKAIGSNPRRARQAGFGEVDCPVMFGGVTFTPGAMVWSDEDGVVTAAA